MLDISVIDTTGSVGEPCGCGEEAMFIILIHGRVFVLCEECFAELGHCVIEGLR